MRKRNELKEKIEKMRKEYDEIRIRYRDGIERFKAFIYLLYKVYNYRISEIAKLFDIKRQYVYKIIREKEEWDEDPVDPFEKENLTDEDLERLKEEEEED